MKRIILLLFVLLLGSSGLQAQLELEKNPIDSVFSNVDLQDPYAELIIETHIVNQTGADVTLEWEKFIINTPQDTIWEAAVCIGLLCYPFETTKSPEPFVAKNGELTLVSAHLRPRGMAGCGTVEVSITDEMSGAELLRPSYTFKVNVQPNCSPITSTKEIKRQLVRISPNPTTDRFTLSSAEEIDQLVVYNILGRRMRTFDANGQQEYSLSGLPGGTYLLQFVGKSGAVLGTQRISKQ